jgi:hypothetical protein
MPWPVGLDRLHGADTSPVLLRGFPVKPVGPLHVYGGFVSAEVRDLKTVDAIATRIPERLATALEWGREAVFVGLVHFTARRG